MVYEQCLSERNSTLMSIFGHAEKIPENIPISGTLLNITSGNGSLDNLIMPELPYCDLEKELDNVSCKGELFFSCFFFTLLSHVTIITIIPVSIGHRFGFHHLHWSDQSISRRSILVSTVLLDVIYIRHRFSIWYSGRSRHQYRWYETLPELKKGDSDRLISQHIRRYNLNWKKLQE